MGPPFPCRTTAHTKWPFPYHTITAPVVLVQLCQWLLGDQRLEGFEDLCSKSGVGHYPKSVLCPRSMPVDLSSCYHYRVVLLPYLGSQGSVSFISLKKPGHLKAPRRQAFYLHNQHDKAQHSSFQQHSAKSNRPLAAFKNFNEPREEQTYISLGVQNKNLNKPNPNFQKKSTVIKVWSRQPIWQTNNDAPSGHRNYADNLLPTHSLVSIMSNKAEK